MSTNSTYIVRGMTCGNCASKVTSAVAAELEKNDDPEPTHGSSNHQSIEG